MGKRFAKLYDTFMLPLEQKRFRKIRLHLLKQAKGEILELGSGTGINFPLYPPTVQSIIAIEPNPFMIAKSLPKSKIATAPIRILKASAESLPFDNHSFDTVVATLVFCSISDPQKAVNEMKRVCRNDGRILLFEHVKLKNPLLANLQNVLNPFWKKICDDCCLNRDTLRLLENNGFQIEHVAKFYKGLFIMVVAKNRGNDLQLVEMVNKNK